MKLFDHGYPYPALDLRAHAEDTELYVLDASYKVLGARVREGEVPIGKAFFSLFSVSSGEQALLGEYLWNVKGRELLLVSGSVPMLILGGAFFQTGMIVVLLPHRGIGQLLQSSTCLEEMCERVYSRREVPCTEREMTVQDREAVLRWYRAVTAGLFLEGFAWQSGDAAVRELSACAQRLAALCGCEIECDLSGMGLCAGDSFIPEFYATGLLAAMLVCRRIGEELSLKLYAQRCFGLGPVLYVRMWLRDGRAALPEFSALRRATHSRGVFFDILVSDDYEGEVDVRISLCPVDVCEIGIKEVGELLQGRSVLDLLPSEIPLPHRTRLSLEGVGELCFDNCEDD